MLVALLTLAASAPAHAQADAERALEQRVKAAYLYRFTEFVSWPDTAFVRPDSLFVIAVLGRDPLADELRNIAAGRSVAGHAVEVRRVTDIGAMPPAHILFIPDAERPRLRELIRVAPRNALVVTESDGALGQGSIINFVIAEGRVRFEISLDSAEKRALKLSSRLLAVAQNVRTGAP